MEFLYLIVYACLRLWILDVDQPWPAASCFCCLQNTVLYCAGSCSPGTLVTWPWHCLSMIYVLLSSESLVSDMSHVSEFLAPGFLAPGSPVLFCRGKIPRAQGMAACVRNGYGTFRQCKFEFGFC